MEKLREAKPNTTESSRKTYASSIVNLFRAMDVKDPSIDWLKQHPDDVIKHLDQIEGRQQWKKTLLAGIYNLTKEPKYQKVMMEHTKAINDFYQSHKMSEKQRRNVIEEGEIVRIYTDIKQRLVANATPANWVDFWIMSVMSGVAGMAPRRNEYASLKIRNYSKANDNYVMNVKGVPTFFFNQYKTVKKYGTQKEEMSPELRPYFKRWMTINKGDYLFFNPRTYKPMSSSELTKRVHHIFGGKKVGCDLLRSHYLTNKFGHVLKEQEEVAKAMGNSVDAQKMYIKTQ